LEQESRTIDSLQIDFFFCRFLTLTQKFKFQKLFQYQNLAVFYKNPYKFLGAKVVGFSPAFFRIFVFLNRVPFTNNTTTTYM
jgi:hypothetical protein